ncbi:alpha/beta fold hydrolase [Pseudogemmobacter humi]|uniref:Palmitoyl-protein thioesterase ABHD10, mitochondrial n=1 Tax=Pseudogemmobacter humi TaxID=2483812 RepID=A0A3P5X2Z5_9RHOB|nr:alpha/beta hydrolase [Pseudogemmobacter humi]VDC28570.1 Alpha/beta hydrolase family protein [Pseudogemmobacter humi]
MTEYLTSPQGRRLAFNQSPGQDSGLPGIVFLGGFRSDMEGSKALFLEAWAREQGRAFLRFDYSGHGRSSGDFEDGCIGDWAGDARAVIEARTSGPQILVGSSMGGWISLLLARAAPERVAGLVGIAAAPDFTTRTWAELSEDQRAETSRSGRLALPSDYSDEPYIFTRRLFEDGAQNRVLDRPLPLPFPVRLLQGTADTDVPQSEALRLLGHIDSPDLRLTLVKGADHRFSSPDCLALIAASILDVTRAAA